MMMMLVVVVVMVMMMMIFFRTLCISLSYGIHITPLTKNSWDFRDKFTPYLFCFLKFLSFRREMINQIFVFLLLLVSGFDRFFTLS